MNIKLLPKVKKRITDEFGAYIDKNKLYVPPENYEIVIKTITYLMKGEKCYFCGEDLTKNNRTLDHLYSKDYGGITITNNLVPCCKDCNSKKRNLNEKEFYRYNAIKHDAQKIQEFWAEFYLKHEHDRKNFGVTLPDNWYTLKKEFEVLALVSSNDRYKKSKEYLRIAKLYEIYNRICKPVVISGNNVVLDGFLALMFAKNLPEKVEVPFVTLDNVISI